MDLEPTGEIKPEFMFETDLKLTVPADRQLRNDIRQGVERYFLLNKTIPPVSYNTLSEFANTLLASNDWDRSYKAFVMVCCGNAIWRCVVGAIPYDKRMLMLPQCLKNSRLCRGRSDELGLLCSECGNCSISGFLREAEELGYLTIVSEGTIIATRLVESGKVDAIIGVGCMEVLQKIFSSVNKYTVPAIGIPLLTCGCVDTTADAEWIREEIHYLDQRSDIKIHKISNLSEKVKELFNEQFIDRLLHLSGTLTDNLVREVLLAGGKRIRPLLTILACESFNQHPDTDAIHSLALSVECFHKASLVLDDIEDNQSSRYDRETIHVRYGIPVAINLGDLLIGYGYRLIIDSGLSPLVINDCLNVVTKGHIDLSMGQGTELMTRKDGHQPSLKETLTVFGQKTSAAFRVALLLGAVAGGADEKNLKLLDRFSYLIGLAFQIKDDLDDFNPGSHSQTFENPSVLLSVLAENIDPADNKTLEEALQRNDLEILQAMIDRYMIRDLVAKLLKDYLQQIMSCLSDIQNIGLKLVLHEIVGKIFRDYL